MTEINSDDLDVRVTNILGDLGIPASLSGFTYLHKGILMILRDFGGTIPDNSITNFYDIIARECGSTKSRVERAIRHSIEVGCDTCIPEVYYDFFRNTVNPQKGKPTNHHFISQVVLGIKLGKGL